MDNQERDLILDLVSGSLPEAEARAVEAALSGEARTELAMQRSAMAAITANPPAPLTDLERRRLHNMVADGIKDTTREMHAAEVAPPAQPAARPRTMRWMRFAYGAAAAAVFVAAVGVGSQLDIGGDDAAADAPVSAIDDTRVASDAGGDGAESFAGEAQTTTTAASATTTIAQAEGDLLATAPPIAPPVDADFEARDLGRIQAWVGSQVLDGAQEEGADPTLLNCYAVAIEDLPVVAGFISPYRDQSTNQVFDAVGFASEGDGEEAPEVRLYDPLSCELLSATGP